MSGLDEFLIRACLRERHLSKLPCESSDGEKAENRELNRSPEQQQLQVDSVEEKAWNDWSSDTKQPEAQCNDGLQGKSSMYDGSIVSKEVGDEIMANVTLGELSMAEILYGHGYKAKSELKEPVDEKKMVDLGFEDAFTKANLDTSYALQSEISNKPSFPRESSSYSDPTTKNPSVLDSIGLGTSMSSSATRSAVNDNPSKIVDVGFTELPKIPKSSLDKMSFSNKIADVGLELLGPNTLGMYSTTKQHNGINTDSYSDAKLSARSAQPKALSWEENEWEEKQIKSTDIQIAEFQNVGLYTTEGPYVPSAYSSTISNGLERAYSGGTLYKSTTLKPVSDCSPFGKTTSSSERTRATISNDLGFDEYKPFKPDIKARLENSIDFANPSTDVGYVPSFSNSGMSDRDKSDTNMQSFSDSKYVGVKKTSPSMSSSYTGKVLNMKSNSYISFNDLRNASKTTTDPRIEPFYSTPPVVNTASFRLASSLDSITQYDKRSDSNIETLQYSNLTKTAQEVTRSDIVPIEQPCSMSVTMEMKDANLSYVTNALSVSNGNVKRSTNTRDIDEIKRISEGSIQSRSSASDHIESTEKNICNVFGKTITVKESVILTSQRSNSSPGSNVIKSCLVKSIEYVDDVSEFETETAINNTPVTTNKLNEKLKRTSYIESKQSSFDSNDQDLRPTYVHVSAKDVKPKAFKANKIAVQPAGVKTCITIVKPKDAKANSSDMTNKNCRKTSKGSKFMDFVTSLFCCKRRNKAFDGDD